MRILTVRQPWAWAIIHEATDPRDGSKRGHIIGVVDLVAAHVTCPPVYDPERGLCSPWAEPDVWHLHLANPRPLAEPIPYRGALGLRTLDDDTTARVLAQIGDPS